MRGSWTHGCGKKGSPSCPRQWSQDEGRASPHSMSPLRSPIHSRNSAKRASECSQQIVAMKGLQLHRAAGQGDTRGWLSSQGRYGFQVSMGLYPWKAPQYRFHPLIPRILGGGGGHQGTGGAVLAPLASPSPPCPRCQEGASSPVPSRCACVALPQGGAAELGWASRKRRRKMIILRRGAMLSRSRSFLAGGGASRAEERLRGAEEGVWSNFSAGLRTGPEGGRTSAEDACSSPKSPRL